MMQKKTPKEILQQALEALSIEQYIAFVAAYGELLRIRQAHSIETRV